MMQRDQSITVELTEQERAQIEKVAQRHGISVEEYIQRVARQYLRERFGKPHIPKHLRH